MSPKISIQILSIILPLLLASCDASDTPSQAAFPPPTVKTILATAEDISVQEEYPGRLIPVRLAEVRARVSGIVLARTFAEGADVKAGDVLFEIDPAKFEAAVNAVRAQVLRAEAVLALATQQEGRAQGLLQKNVASKDQYDVAFASRKQAEAELEVAKANLQTAELELGYASVRAPIDGRTGAALVTEGAFVRQEDGTQMAIVRDLSSVYVDFTASLVDLDRIQQQPGKQDVSGSQSSVAVEMVDNDGKPYGQPGRLLFSSANVNETTAQVTLRAEFPNPDRKLLPGTYVRVRATTGVEQNAILVPQRAVQWDTLGQARVTLVKDGKAVVQPVTTTRSFGNRWLVKQGLNPGDQIVVDGMDRAMPGSPVTAQVADEEVASASLSPDCASACGPETGK